MKKNKAAPKPTPECLARFRDKKKRVAPAKDAEVVKAHRVRIVNLTKKKESFLNFVHGRLAMEAERVAAFQTNMWEREGKIPSLAGKHKFANLPGSCLGQGLWVQVRGQLKSWLSNAENELVRLIRQASQPGAKHRLTQVAALAKRRADRLAKGEPETDYDATTRKGQQRNRRELAQIAWLDAQQAPVEKAFVAFRALGLDKEAARKSLYAAMKTSARRVGAQNPSESEALVRALWVYVLDRFLAPSWKNMPWWVHPGMSEAKTEAQLTAKAKPAKSTKPSKARRENPRRVAQRKKKQDSRDRRLKAKHCFVLAIPAMGEWPALAQIETDWRKAIVEESKYEPKDVKKSRQAKEKRRIAYAKRVGNPIPKFSKKTRNKVSSRAPKAKTVEIALPFFAGDEFDHLPGKTAASFCLLKPRKSKNRTVWSARVVKTLKGLDLATLAGVLAPGPNSKTGVVGIDAGLRTSMSTSVGVPGGNPGIKGFDEAGKSIQLELDFLLPGWRKRLEPMALALKELNAARQRQGLPVRCEKQIRLQNQLTGFIKVNIESSLKNFVLAARPSAICVEELDLRGARFGKGTNRMIQMMGHGVMRAWLEQNAPLHGYVLWREPAEFSSQQCAACGWIDRGNRQGEKFHCLRCEFRAHSDSNASVCLRERFLWAQWLVALGDKAQALGLGRASIESWMPRPRMLEALWQRECFLADATRVLAAKDAGLLPPEFKEKGDGKGRILAALASKGIDVDWANSASFADHGGASWRAGA